MVEAPLDPIHDRLRWQKMDTNSMAMTATRIRSPQTLCIRMRSTPFAEMRAQIIHLKSATREPSGSAAGRAPGPARHAGCNNRRPGSYPARYRRWLLLPGRRTGRDIVDPVIMRFDIRLHRIDAQLKTDMMSINQMRIGTCASPRQGRQHYRR